jgi:alkanesulfonate monooxygenase SsuD/methylene tetrahydromethanopterin reductase-like flavin-dependent oxidoreductase (luciferase family)
MRFGVAWTFSNYADWDRFEALERGEPAGEMAIPDRRIWEETLAMVELVEPLGFDSIWSLEQHSAPYLMCPDPTQFLTYCAARTKRAHVGSMITVLPWHHPVRLAEQIAVLQHILGPDRQYFLGIGRGLARRNFDAMSSNMDSSRERFNETLDVLQLALTQEVFSYDGQFWQFENVAVRPRPLDPRVITDAWGSWTSETSLRNMAQRGLHPLTTLNKTMEDYVRELAEFYAIRESCGYGPGQRPIFEAPLYCCESEQEAREGVEQYFAEYIDSVVRLYEIGTENFATSKGYEEYHSKGSQYGDGTAEDAQKMLTNKLLRDAIWGTPDQCAERIAAVRELVDPSEVVVFLGLGSMSCAQSEKSMRLYAEKVLPRFADLRRRAEPVAAR